MGDAFLGLIGNTPLTRLPFRGSANIYAKLEYLNPGGSVKDRTALFMIEEAERKGLLKKGGTIIETSSGNQGIALAMIGAAKGYKVIITVSEKISEEKLKAIEAYGAMVIVCPSTEFVEDPESSHSRAAALQKSLPGAFMPNQYFNTTNPLAHYRGIGPEIWRQTEGKITHFFAAAGTGGTVSGAGRFFKEQNPNVKVIAVDAATSFRSTRGRPRPYKVDGMGVDFETPCLDENVIDEFIPVTDDEALETLPFLAKNYGLLVGPSSGAVAYALLDYLKKFKETDVVVAVLADSGRAYLSKNCFSLDRESNQFQEASSERPFSRNDSLVAS